MGNTPSDNNNSNKRGVGNNSNNNNNSVVAVTRNLLRKNNALGLSKSELDERCRPSGLYPNCSWEIKAIRRLIGDGKLAARLVGSEEETVSTNECPICFLHYTEINITKCCQATLCTECFLQVKPQNQQNSHYSNSHSHPTRNTNNSLCPFCNAPRLQVTVQSGKRKDDIDNNDNIKNSNIKPEAAAAASGCNSIAPESNPGTNATSQLEAPSTPKGNNNNNNNSFGSHLEKNERIQMLRARSSSMNSDSQSNTNKSPIQEITTFAMTIEERKQLESEMKAQHHHPLTLRLEQEEAERRIKNELQYYTQRANASQSLSSNSNGFASRQYPYHPRTIRDIRGETTPPSHLATAAVGNNNNNHISSSAALISPRSQVIRLGAGGSGGVDDNAVMEAAIKLSMEDRARIGNNNNNYNNSSNPIPLCTGGAARLSNNNHSILDEYYGGSRNNMMMMSTNGLSEEQQIAMAIAASLQNNNDNNNNEQNNNDNNTAITTSNGDNNDSNNMNHHNNNNDSKLPASASRT